MKQSVAGTLDDLDLALMREMEINARQSYSELAGKLGTSSTTVLRRLQRLQEQGIIRFATIADVGALEYRILVIMCLNVRPGTVDDTAHRLTSYTAVKHVFMTAGRYDIIVWAYFRNSKEWLNFFSDGLGAIPEVTEVETIVVQKPMKNSWKYLGADDRILERPDTNRNLDAVDLALIKELEIEPRETIKELARRIGISANGTSRRLQTLIDGKVLRIVSIPNLPALGYNVSATLLIKINPGNINTVANQLTGHQTIKSVAIVSGSFNLFAYADFRDLGDMYDFMRNELGKIPGVIRHESMITLSIAQMSFDLVRNSDQVVRVPPDQTF
ncbi:MAG: Lrp/AsnC family transcriptional regulator [Dehalococcoidia bacterium]|nr:Lrp/AsnC family transcriptional regulator [Dehalococcoidia bacterium]